MAVSAEHSSSRVRHLLALFLVMLPSLGLAQGLPIATPEEVGFSSDKLTQVDALLQQVVGTQNLPGVAVTLVRDGKVFYQRAFGYADIESQRPLDSNNLFRLASISKIVTTVAIMKLYEDGRLNLDDPVSKYIPELAQPSMFTNVDCSDPSAPKYDLVRTVNEIKIRQILNHTSGIGYRYSASCPLLNSYMQAGIYDGFVQVPYTTAGMISTLGRQPLLFEPGTAINYGLSADVAGRIVEVVSGQRFGDYLKEHIFDPLEMTDTAFFVPQHEGGRFPSLYLQAAPGILIKMPPGVIDLGALVFSGDFPYSGPTSYDSGGAGLVSTSSDLTRFMQMVLNGGKLKTRDNRRNVHILKPKTVKLMITLAPEDMDFPGLPGYKFGKGFAIHVDPSLSGRPGSVGTIMWGGLFSPYFHIDPTQGLVLLFMAQRLPPPFELYPEFERRVYKAMTEIR